MTALNSGALDVEVIPSTNSHTPDLISTLPQISHNTLSKFLRQRRPTFTNPVHDGKDIIDIVAVRLIFFFVPEYDEESATQKETAHEERVDERGRKRV